MKFSITVSCRFGHNYWRNVEPKETWEACEKKIQNIIADRSGKVDDVEIDRCHRIEPHKTKTSQNRDRPRTAVCRVNRFKNKQRILNNATPPPSRPFPPWKTRSSLYMKIFQRTPWNLESYYGNKFWIIGNNINSHA